MKKLKNLSIDILTEDKKWDKLSFSYKDVLEKTIRLALEDNKQFVDKFYNKEVEVSVVLTNDKSIQKLNKEYRNKDKPTNVLSFPMIEDFDNEVENELSLLNLISLGDIILSYETILNESKEEKKSFKNHFIHLIIHSVLHLMGYYHETKNQAKAMENKEIELLSGLGIQNSYL
ncbi:rRNA maturation RNase YbeY [Pseudomonadota bacterium]